MSTAYDLVLQHPFRWPRPAPLIEPRDERTKPPAIREEVRALRAALGDQQQQSLRSGSELISHLDRQRRDALPSMLLPLDQLVGGGLQKGKLTEIHGTRSSGRFSIVLSLLASVTSCGEPAALVDHGDALDPQLAAEAGVELERLLWVRPRSVKEAVHASELLLATQFPLVVIDLGLRLRGKRVADAAWVRLARAAGKSGSVLLVSSPFPVTATAAEAVVRSRRSRAQWSGEGTAPRLLTGLESNLSLEKLRRHAPSGTSLLRTKHELAIVPARSS